MKQMLEGEKERGRKKMADREREGGWVLPGPLVGWFQHVHNICVCGALCTWKLLAHLIVD